MSAGNLQNAVLSVQSGFLDKEWKLYDLPEKEEEKKKFFFRRWNKRNEKL